MAAAVICLQEFALGFRCSALFDHYLSIPGGLEAQGMWLQGHGVALEPEMEHLDSMVSKAFCSLTGSVVPDGWGAQGWCPHAGQGCLGELGAIA